MRGEAPVPSGSSSASRWSLSPVDGQAALNSPQLWPIWTKPRFVSHRPVPDEANAPEEKQQRNSFVVPSVPMAPGLLNRWLCGCQPWDGWLLGLRGLDLRVEEDCPIFIPNCMPTVPARTPCCAGCAGVITAWVQALPPRRPCARSRSLQRPWCQAGREHHWSGFMDDL